MRYSRETETFGDYQDSESVYSFCWTEEEQTLPRCFLVGIEALVVSAHYLFCNVYEYAFHCDCLGRLSLRHYDPKVGNGKSLAEIIEKVWQEDLRTLTRSSCGQLRYSANISDFGTNGFFLRRMLLTDAVLRLNPHERTGEYEKWTGFWGPRTTWERQRFLDELYNKA